MADAKKENPALMGLREREAVLTQKLSDLDTKVDANHQMAVHNVDVREIKQKVQKQLAEVKTEIAKLSK